MRRKYSRHKKPQDKCITLRDLLKVSILDVELYLYKLRDAEDTAEYVAEHLCSGCILDVPFCVFSRLMDSIVVNVLPHTNSEKLVIYILNNTLTAKDIEAIRESQREETPIDDEGGDE